MGLSILPKGGAGFRSSSGFGNFQSRLKKLTAREGGEFGSLKNNQEAISSAIAKHAGQIQKSGGLSRSQQKSVYHEIAGSDKSLSGVDKGKIKEILSYYSRGRKEKPAAERPRPGVLSVAKKPHIGINRDPSFQQESEGLSVQEQQAGRFALRGEASRAAISYGRMQNLGGGESARKLQKGAFEKLQQTGGLRPNSRPGGSPASRPLNPLGR